MTNLSAINKLNKYNLNKHKDVTNLTWNKTLHIKQ